MKSQQPPARIPRDPARRRGRRLAAVVAVVAVLVAPAISAPAAMAAPFAAGASTIFVAQNQPTRLYGAVNTGTELTFNPIGPTASMTYNALAYHEPSRYLYAISGTRLYRIDDTGALTNVAAVVANSNAGAFAGDLTDRYYYRTATQLHWYNVANGNSGSSTLSQTFGPADFAWSNGYFWGMGFDSTSLTANPVIYRMSTTGAVSTFTVPGITRQNFTDPATATSFGGAWTYGNGNLGFTNNAGGTVQIAVRNAGTTPQFDVISFMNGPASGNNDAAASPGSPVDLSIAKTVDATVTQAGQRLEYTLTVRNETANSLSSGYTVSDALPAGVTLDEATLPTRCTVAGTSATGQSFSCAEGPLASGTPRDLVFSVTIDASVPRGAILTNSASVLGNEADPVTSNNSATASTTVAAPKLTLAKSVAYDDVTANGNPDVGEQITWTFVVRNTGDYPATGVSITDPLVTGVSPSQQNIAVGATGTFTATSTVTQAMVDAGSLTNTATATGTSGGGSFTTPPASATLTLRALPKLQAVKSATLVDGNGNGVADTGETIEYTVTVTNTGNVTIFGVSVDDDLVSVTPASVTLAPGATQAFTADYVVTAADVAAGSVTNVASASGTAPGGVPVESEESSTTTETARAGLTLVKSAIDPDQLITAAGDTVTYRFIVTNTGNTLVSGATITDPSIDGGTLTPASQNIPAGGQVTFTATRTVTQNEIDQPNVVAGLNRLTNTATATGTPAGGSPITSNTSTVLTPLVEHLPETTTFKSASFYTDANGNGKADVGDVIQYEVRVVNTGNVTVSNVEIIDPLAAASPFTFSSLAPGEFARVVYPYTVDQDDVDAGGVLNVATATADDPGGDPLDPSEGRTTTPGGGAPLLHAVKSAALNDVNANGVADEGEEISYSVEVWNRGEVTAANVIVDDPMAGDFTPVSASIAPGASVVFTADDPYVVTAADVAAGVVTNTATAEGVDPRDPTVPVTSPPTTTETSTPAPALTIQKRAQLNDANANGRADVGETIDYSFVVANNGNVTIEDISVDDPMLTGLAPSLFSLDAGRSLTVTADAYVVTDQDVINGSIDNSATATGTPIGGSPFTSQPSTTTTPTVSAATSYTSVKTATLDDGNGNGYADVDETITYSVVVTNTGTLSLTGVSVSDPMLGVVTPATQDVAPGQTVGFSGAPYVVTQADVDAGEIVNVATVTGTDATGDPLVPQTPTARVDPVPPAPSLATTKSFTLNDTNGNGLADEGETIDFAVVVSNTGNVTVTGVAPVDPMIAAFTPATVDLAPGASQTFAASPYTVTAADVDEGVVSNTATSTGAAPGGTPVAGPPSTVTVVTADPGILIEKKAAHDDSNGNGVADLGETITYTFEVTNTGNVRIVGAAVTDPRVSDITPSAATIEPGDVQIFQAAPYVVTEDDLISGALSNTATAAGTLPGGDPLVSGPSTVTVSPAALSPSLVIEKSAVLEDDNDNGRGDEGESIRFSFVVTNTGNATLTDVSVDDPMVAGLTPAAVASLAPGESAVFTAEPYTVTAADAVAGEVQNVATAIATDPAGDPMQSVADSVTVSTHEPDHDGDVDVLPPTGGNASWALIPGAAALLLAGIALLILRRRRGVTAY